MQGNTPEQLMRQVNAGIKKHGFFAIATSAPNMRGQLISLVYTVGLHLQGLPELFMFGVPPKTAKETLDKVVKTLTGTRELPLDMPVAGYFNKYPAYFKKVLPDMARGYLNVAIEHAGHPVDAIQVIWPDESGKFPWDVNFNPAMRDLQPIRARPMGQGGL